MTQMTNHFRYLVLFVVALGAGCIDAPSAAMVDAGVPGDLGPQPEVGLQADAEASDAAEFVDAEPDVDSFVDGGTPEDLGSRPDAGGQRIAVFVVDSPLDLNTSDEQVRMLLQSDGFDVTVLAASDTGIAQLTPHVFVVSKTADAILLEDSLRETTSGIVTWEDRLVISGRLGLATENATSWHSLTTSVFVEGEGRPVPNVLSGVEAYYTTETMITWAPCTALIAGARVLARDAQGSDRCTHYVVGPGEQLTDGSALAGRRAFFGLDDDSFQKTTPGARQFFSAVVSWTASAP